MIEDHINTVTVDSMLAYRSKSFVLYASARGIKLGFNGDGLFVVKGEEDYVFTNPGIAIEKYAELIRGKI